MDWTYSPYPRPMPVSVIVPIKSFTSGKGRLAGVLAPDVRARLSRALADHVTTAVAATGRTTLIVTDDPAVAQWAGSTGLTVVDDPGRGLSEAARAGVSRAIGESRPWLVLHSDLPWLSADDVEAVARPVERGDSVLAPSADGGTSAIGGHDQVAFRFGPSSFHSHLVILGGSPIVAKPGLLLDVDNPSDLEAAANSPRGRWLEDALLSPA